MRIVRESVSDMGTGSPCDAIAVMQDSKKVVEENQTRGGRDAACRKTRTKAVRSALPDLLHRARQ